MIHEETVRGGVVGYSGSMVCPESGPWLPAAACPAAFHLRLGTPNSSWKRSWFAWYALPSPKPAPRPSAVARAVGAPAGEQRVQVCAEGEAEQTIGYAARLLLCLPSTTPGQERHCRAGQQSTQP